MNPLRKSTLVFVLINVTALTLPIYLSGCGGAASPVTTAATSTSATSGNSGGSDANSTSQSSGASTSGSGGTSTSSSGASASGSGTDTSTSGAVAPAQALVVSNIQRLSNWDGVYDSGTGSGTSTSTGAMSMIASPSLSGSARKFETSFTNNGGERYWVSFGADTATTNFLYDTWIYLDDSSANIGNIELDMNQVIGNGQTVIYGVQCDGWSGTWDYTVNNGTPTQPKGGWVHVKTAPCNPRQWTKNVWHHVQMTYSRDNSGNVTYKSVWLDGVRQDLNVTAPSAFALGWSSGALLANFQVDGLGTSGTATVYLDNLTIYRW